MYEEIKSRLNSIVDQTVRTCDEFASLVEVDFGNKNYINITPTSISGRFTRGGKTYKIKVKEQR